MLHTIATVLSIVFHPLFVPLYVLAASSMRVFGTIGASVVTTYYSIGVAILFCGLPVLSIAMLKLGGAVADWHLTRQRDRLIVMAMTATVLITGLLRMERILSHNYVVHLVLVAEALCCLLCLFVNFFYRLSAHSIGLAGVVGLLLRLAYQYGGEPFTLVFMAFLVALGAVVWARLYLNAHTVGQCLWAIGGGGVLGWFAPYFIRLAHI